MTQTREPVALVLPAELLHFARACAAHDDISEVVVVALMLLRAELLDVGDEIEAPNYGSGFDAYVRY
jgi:hypothetical protein